MLYSKLCQSLHLLVHRLARTPALFQLSQSLLLLLLLYIRLEQLFLQTTEPLLFYPLPTITPTTKKTEDPFQNYLKLFPHCPKFKKWVLIKVLKEVSPHLHFTIKRNPLLIFRKKKKNFISKINDNFSFFFCFLFAVNFFFFFGMYVYMIIRFVGQVRHYYILTAAMVLRF